jgi:hypothetical protein
MDLGASPVLPALRLPEPALLPRPVLEVPRALLPTYKPLVVPPSDLRPPPGIQGSEASEEEPQKNEPTKPKPQVKVPPTPPKEVQMVDVPFTDVEIPMPSTEIMTAAATTAVISVAATLTATSIFKYLVMVMKPVVKQTWNKITKKKK